MKQFFEIKEKYPDAILLFRMGDFYETFGEDAKIASDVLGIVLTTRDKNKKNPIPMAGFPHHAAKNYIARLVKAGYKVAICEQLEDPSKSRGIVKRGVVEIITPGSFIDEDYLPERRRSDVLFVYPYEFRGTKSRLSIPAGKVPDQEDNFCVALAWADVSTGQFSATDVCSVQAFVDVLSRVEPVEVVFPHAPEKVSSFEALKKEFTVLLKDKVKTYFPEVPIFEHPYAIEDDLKWYTQRFVSLLGVKSLKGYGIDEGSPVLTALLYLFSYLVDYQMKPLKSINLNVEKEGRSLLINEGTYRHLEIDRLADVLDNTSTSMGGRLLREYLKAPVSSLEEIKNRQTLLRFFSSNLTLARKVRENLKGVPDLQRLLYRFVLSRGTPYDAYRLLKGSERVLEVRELLSEAMDEKGGIPEDVGKEFLLLEKFSQIVSLLKDFLKEDIVPGQSEDFVREGYDELLDRYREFSQKANDILQRIQEEERNRTGIQNLKVGYNRVFGYYIEVPKTQVSKVPEDYIRKQTLVSYERYTFPRLQEVENEILDASEKFALREKELFESISQILSEKYSGMLNAFHALAKIDLFSSHAIFAFEKNYTVPEVVEAKVLRIKAGRHPLVEGFVDEPFVPNDTGMDEKRFFYLITGPNMAGKSTYIRQVGIIVLLAHAGLAVPADEAVVGLADALFTRVGASDNLSRGESTFFSEMLEVAQILNRSTEKSVVILDEVGRGTSTSDGEAIARAVAEDLHNRIKPRTFFATHYHELTDLEDYLPGVVNYTFAVEKWRGEIVFLKKLIRGRSTKSYGIEVAAMAGVPPHVIERAREILARKEPKTSVSSMRYGASMENRKVLSGKSRKSPQSATPAGNLKGGAVIHQPGLFDVSER